MTFFSHELAIDLGTANTVIFRNGEIVLDEPSVVAVDAHTGSLVAVGAEAQLMEGKEHQGIMTIRPLLSGVIADFDAAENMINGFIKKMTGKKILLENVVDPSCLGGVRLDYDGKRVDDTIQHRLDALRGLLKNTIL